MPNGNRAAEGRNAEPTVPIYVHKHSSYDRSTQVPNVTAQNERLSWAARGLLTYMLSLPADWQLNETDLVGRSPAGRDHLRSILRELEGAGYLHRSRLRNRAGRVVQSIWKVWDLPQTDLPQTENPSMGRTRSTTGVLPQTEIPSVAEPQTEIPSVAKTQFTTDSVSTRQQTAFPSTENPSVYKETFQQKKHLNQQPSKNPYPETTEPMGTRAEGTNPRALGTNPRALGTNPRAQSTNPRALGTNPRAQGTNPRATTVNPQTADLPESLECYRQQISDFWSAKRSGSAKTPAAFKLLVSNLLRIQADDPAAVGQQLDKATQGGFRSITHENWLKYDRPSALRAGNGSEGDYPALTASADTTGFDEFRAAYLAARKRATNQSIPKAISAYGTALSTGITPQQLLAALRANIRAQHEAEAHGGFAVCLPDMFRWLRDGLYEAHMPRSGAPGTGTGATPPPPLRRVPDGPVDDPVALCDQIMAARRAAALA